MKICLSILLGFSASCLGQGISTKDINPGFATRIYVNADTETVIHFPKSFSGVYGKDCSTEDSQKDGVMRVKAFPDKSILVLHPMKPDVRLDMTVYMEGKLWAFKVISSPRPDTQLTLVEGDSPAEEVSTKEVIASRVKYDPATLTNLMYRAKGVMLLKKADPEHYKGYQRKECDSVRDDGILKTVVNTVHKFPQEDAIVLEGQISNLTDQPFVLHDNKIIVMADEGRYAPTFINCNNWQPIPAHANVPFLVEILGNSTGGRAYLDINNEFKLAIDTGAKPTPSPSVPKSTPAP